jgi:hypothetical protein
MKTPGVYLDSSMCIAKRFALNQEAAVFAAMAQLGPQPGPQTDQGGRG